MAFSLIHIVLVWFPLAHQPYGEPIVFCHSKYRALAYQEGIGIPVETLREPPPLKPMQKIALILELPAMFVATLVGAVLVPRNDVAWLYTSIPLVLLVWYAIGRWLDGLLGYSSRLYLPGILRGLFTDPAVGVLFVRMAGLTPRYHHRTADTCWIFSGLMLWSGLCLAIIASSARRLR